MKHRSPKILYFSLLRSRITSFWTWVDEEGCKYCKNAFFSRAEAPKKFTHTADLPSLLNQYDGNLQSLHVIIDFESIKGINNVDIIRDVIVEFPEVQFLFDKHYAGGLTSLSFLFPNDELEKYIRSYPKDEQNKLKLLWNDLAKNIDCSLFELYLNNPNDDFESSIIFSRIINGFDNTFDASNLRFAIKFRKSLHLKVHHSRNFKKTQNSRFQNLAICVEEESKQNIFNSYSLYVNGYRVLPITIRQELEIVNDNNFNLPNACPYDCKWKNNYCEKHGIILRDFDLQFEDEDQAPVDAIRGFRFCEEEDLAPGSFFRSQVCDFGNQLCKDCENLNNCYRVGWNILTLVYNKEPNIFWNRLVTSGYPLYYITKGPKHSRIDHPERNQEVYIEEKTKDIIEELHLPGLTKPVCGLYSPLQGLPEVKTTYQNTRYFATDSDYEIRISRKEHDHSTPLDIYDMANNMIRRAESYYNEKRYLLAALVSGEALEFLNGFHHRLMVKAFFIQAIAENAIAMDVVGANELYLAKDAMFRVKKIKEDVDRFYYGYEEKSKWNILNHIFSTCRQFCKDHEHFESESVFISAIGHLNEGYEIPDIINEIKTIMRKFWNELISLWRLIMKWIEEKKHNKDGE